MPHEPHASPEGSRRSASRSSTHDRAVLEQDNGELQEDIVPKRALDEDPAGADERVTEESEASFPASDAPSGWAGRPSGTRDVADDERVHGRRVVARADADEVPERGAPDEPLPRTLPR